MGALLALLIPMIPGLIQGAQAIFAHVKTAPPPAAKPTPIATVPPVQPSSVGATKAAVVLQQLRAVIQSLAAINAPLPDGTLPATIPVTDDALAGMVETIFQQLKASNSLEPAGPTGVLWLVQGTVQPLKGA